MVNVLALYHARSLDGRARRGLCAGGAVDEARQAAQRLKRAGELIGPQRGAPLRLRRRRRLTK